MKYILLTLLLIIPLSVSAQEDFAYDDTTTSNGLYRVVQTESLSAYDIVLQTLFRKLALTCIVSGYVRCTTSSQDVDGAVIRSSGVGATVSSRGEYILSEIPGSWTLTARKTGYNTKTVPITISQNDEQIRKDINMTCPDHDFDRICDVDDPSQDMDNDGVLDGQDNCPNVPNSPMLGTCIWGSRKWLSCTSLNGCGCNTDSRLGCVLSQWESYESAPQGVPCGDPCMESSDKQACFDIYFDPY